MRRGDEKYDESGDCRSERERANRTARDASHGFSENSCDAHEKRVTRLMTIKRHGEAQVARAMLFKPVQSAGIGNRVGTSGEGKIVAAQLAFMTDARADPPNGRMEEEER